MLYDVLNNIVVDATISDSKTHEINITIDEHLRNVKEDDLIIFDRGYPSYRLFSTINSKYKAHYLIRMKKNIYKKHTAILIDETLLLSN